MRNKIMMTTGIGLHRPEVITKTLKFPPRIADIGTIPIRYVDLTDHQIQQLLIHISQR